MYGMTGKYLVNNFFGMARNVHLVYNSLIIFLHGSFSVKLILIILIDNVSAEEKH